MEKSRGERLGLEGRGGGFYKGEIAFLVLLFGCGPCVFKSVFVDENFWYKSYIKYSEKIFGH